METLDIKDLGREKRSRVFPDITTEMGCKDIEPSVSKIWHDQGLAITKSPGIECEYHGFFSCCSSSSRIRTDGFRYRCLFAVRGPAWIAPAGQR